MGGKGNVKNMAGQGVEIEKKGKSGTRATDLSPSLGKRRHGHIILTEGDVP